VLQLAATNCSQAGYLEPSWYMRHLPSHLLLCCFELVSRQQGQEGVEPHLSCLLCLATTTALFAVTVTANAPTRSHPQVLLCHSCSGKAKLVPKTPGRPPAAVLHPVGLQAGGPRRT
jgi:hypothetical protein